MDDAWIHQRIARNFAEGKGLAFNPLSSVSASTAPVWSMLLSLAYILRIDPVFFTNSLAFLFFIMCLFLLILQGNQSSANDMLLFTVIMICLDWRIIWSVVSGMETALFLFTAGITLLTPLNAPLWLIFLRSSLPMIIRPEGMLLCIAQGVNISINRYGAKRWYTPVIYFIFGSALLVLLRSLLLQELAPSTFLAKVCNPNWSRVSFLTGLLLLIPPVCYPFLIKGLITRSILRKHRIWIIWSFFHLAFYFVFLPVNYHHDRYLVPLLAGFYLFCAEGLWTWSRIQSRRKLFVLLMISFQFVSCIMGVGIYRQDVQCIQQMQVTIGNWFASLNEPDRCIATDDIGAIGYFSKMQIIDLRGLANPENIQYQFKDTLLISNSIEAGADYFALYPKFYDVESRTRLKEVKKVRLTNNTICADDEMIVYKVSAPSVEKGTNDQLP